MSLAELCIGKQLKCREHVAEGGNTSGRGQRPRPSPVPPNLIMLTIFVLILFKILFQRKILLLCSFLANPYRVEQQIYFLYQAPKTPQEKL